MGPFLLLIAPAAAFAVLAAHFVRAQQWPAAAVCVALMAVMAVPRAWAVRTVQVALVAGALEWVRTLAGLLSLRMALGQPYLRMAAILAVVALLTLAAALVFRAPRLRAYFRLG